MTLLSGNVHILKVWVGLGCFVWIKTIEVLVETAQLGLKI